MKNITRKVTDQLLEMINEGALDPMTVVEACFNYMSEAEVVEMARSTELIDVDEDEGEELEAW